jgi:nicotinamide phosphoribosyltransferase
MTITDNAAGAFGLRGLSILTATDSYKASHYAQYPPGTTRVSSYIEARGGRFPSARFFGLQAIIKSALLAPVTANDIEAADALFTAHGVPFNRAGWQHILDAHGGRLPLEIAAVPEGTDVPVNNVLVQVVNTDPLVPWLTSYVETALMQIWYPTTVASLSAAARAIIFAALDRSSDDPAGQIAFRLHDFGARGSTSMVSAGIGGLAHLVNFSGTDTVPALLAARQWYHEPMAGFSIPAMEHSTVTSWGRSNEVAAFRNMLQRFGGPGKTIAMVVDSYDMNDAVTTTIGVDLRDEILASGGTVVIRPDSGDPRITVPHILRSLARSFGSEINHKGYRVLNPAVRVIQGDGMDLDAIDELYRTVTGDGWSAENVTVGMGGGLLQKIDRDTMRFAMKASAIEIDDVWTDVYKDPKTDPGKRSKRGRLALVNNETAWNDFAMKTGLETVREADLHGRVNLLRPVFRNGELLVDEPLSVIRRRAGHNPMGDGDGSGIT